MPELPEVEVVRRGLERWTAGRTIASAEALHPRAVRRHSAGAADFADRLRGRVVGVARRRGKYLWIPLDGGPAAVGETTAGTVAGETAASEPAAEALLGHLGMSGQLLVQPREAPDETHL
ncbi:MAG TPA: DNA-formamidopyrimidine glycosylase family protein, partial [Actinocrinis sp.]|uniref:DNA-formamidopyrimidine glycosylase family protein n=1 Tax=Actinocrinis sp. TaxID=1920516 RepID=UPI002DDCCAF7